jgi:hypothetical protein
MTKISKSWIWCIFKAAEAQYIEAGLIEGIQQGVEQGIRQCIEQGYRPGVNKQVEQDIEERVKRNVAEKLVQMDIDCTDISEATDISMAEMAQIRKRLEISE